MKGYSAIAACAVIAVVIFAGMLYFNPGKEQQSIKKFDSLTEVGTYIKNNVGSANYGYYESFGGARTGVQTLASGMDAAPKASSETSGGSADFSQTNVQVEGVDESDVIKNDDKYIYTISGNNVVIVDAYPAENAKIVSILNATNETPENLFVNGNKLVVFGSINDYNVPYYGPVVKTFAADSSIGRYYSPQMFVNIFDITDRSNPSLVSNLTIEGDYFDSRMIGDYVYLVSTKYIYEYDNIVLPMVEGVRESSFPGVYYFDNPDNSYMFATIFAINTQSSEATRQVFLLGAAQEMYVSQQNMYIIYTKYLSMADFIDRYIDEAVLPFVPDNVKSKIQEIRISNETKYDKMNKVSVVINDYATNLTEEERQNFYNSMYDKMNKIQEELSSRMEKTVIQKMPINGNRVDYSGNGEVPGHVLNQFSMDEYNGYFRVATTSGSWQKQENNVYVLDGSMNVVGKLEDLASGESIHSARFIGDRLYLVTFKKTDPLFVISLENPSSPAVLGELKIPGYSDYLHPYDETHIIGIGKEAVEAEQGDFAWYQGMKVALFDVSDVSNPKQISNFVIGDRGTDSEVLYNHKAFLFSKSKNLLVMPVTVAEVDRSQYQGGETPDWAYGQQVWQGAYVFSLTLDNGIQLRDRITHMTNLTKNEYGYIDLPYEYFVKRSLYMDEVLYTFSEKTIKMNSLNDLSEMNKINLPGSETDYWPRLMMETTSSMPI